jgi:transposase
MGQQQTTTSERIDELPVVISYLKQMQVDLIIDRVLGPAHGNWEGLSRGELALVYVSYVVMNCTHFLSPLQAWVTEHQQSLVQALGKPVREADGTDDRMAVVLSGLGDESTRPGEQIEQELGQHLVRAYALPTDTARIDMTTVSVHHQPANPDGLLRFGHSKDHRPDLRQFKEALGTLDPVGLPLATATLSGEQADDPNYLPIWERLVATLGRPDFLTVADCKLASLANRAQIQFHGGFYLAPLPMTGTTPDELRQWVLRPPVRMQKIRLADQAATDTPVGQGFSLTVPCVWIEPGSQVRRTWEERRLVVQSQAHAERQRAGLHARLEKAERAVQALNANGKATTDPRTLDTRAQAILAHAQVAEYLSLTIRKHVQRHTRYVGPGRPGPQRAKATVETHTWTVHTRRRPAAIREFERLAGWRVYVTNTPANRLSVSGAVDCYRQEWQPEHGFHRLKGGLLAIMPLYLRDEQRIRGLLVLLGIALRFVTLTEFCVRRDLAVGGETLPGLYEGNPARATAQPTTERLLKAFHNLTLYRHETPTEIWFEVTSLSVLQRRIWRGLGLPESIYAPPTSALIDSRSLKMAER